MKLKELIDYCNVLKESKSRFINCIDVDRIIDTIKQLDEPEKVKVPQCVHKYIQEAKEYNWDLQDLMKSIDDEMMPGVQVVEKVVYKESPTARLPDYFNNNNEGKIIKWKQSRRYRGGRN